MKKLSAFVLIALVALSLWAAAPATSPKLVTFKWQLNPADLGGMTTNQYLTNITFSLLSVTDCTIPTNQWPVITNWLASTFPSADGANWTNAVITDGATRFFLIQVANGNG